MAKTGHVCKRMDGKNYRARLRVPADLIPIIERSEMTKSLGTSDYQEAKKRARTAVAEWEAHFQDLRARRDMTEADLQSAAVEQYRRRLDEDVEARNRLPIAADIEAARHDLVEKIRRGEVDGADPLAILNASLDYPALLDAARHDREQRKILLTELRSQVATGETAIINSAVEAYIDRHKLTVEPGSPQYRDLAHRLARADIEALKRTLERDKGDFTGTPADPLLSDVGIAPRDSTTFDTIIERQLERVAKGIGGRRKGPATIRKYKGVMADFAAWRGSPRAATVTVHEVEQWRDVLFSAHSQKTVLDKITTVRTILAWGNKQTKGKMFPRGFPLALLELPAKPKVNSEERAYTMDQARMILKAARAEKIAYRRWIPWLLAYTGMRINEVTQLEKSDIFALGDDWFAHVRVEGEARTTKTMKARKIPLHPDLVKEDFIRFVQAASDGKLFPVYRTGENMGTWINRLMKDVPRENNPPPNHGFRHLWEDLRRARLEQGAANYIAGRSNGTSDDQYGKSNAMLPALALEMRKFPSLL